MQALAGLSELGGADAERALLTASRDTDPGVTNSALSYLGRIKTPSALGRLEEVALGTDSDFTQQAMGVLASAAPERAASLAEQLSRSEDPNARIAVARIAVNLPGAQAERILTAAARDAEADVAREAIGNLASVGGPAAVGTLVEVLKNDGAPSEVRAAAAQTLYAFGGSVAEANSALIEQFISPSSEPGSE
jgi:HEAT repeat protein